MTAGPDQDDDLDVLPETTSDETSEGWGETSDEESNDARLEEDRPPHW